MSNEILGDRRKALEEAFFARENEKLRQRLRDLDQTKRRKEAFAAASGVTDDAVLERLAALDLSGETFAALSLVPLVAVAWADGSIDGQGRAAAFARAAEAGVAPGDVSHALLERWLSDRPPPTLVPAWKAYVRALADGMSPEDRRAFKAKLLHRAHEVAQAAGGILGLRSKVSPTEQSVLDDLASAVPA